MANKVILVILDGLRFDIAQSSMGYLGHLVETDQASLYTIQAELPTLSRPLYEVLLTGTPASIHGITANDVARLSHQVSLFDLAVQQGLTTAAAAFHWFSELYQQAPFNPFQDRAQHDLRRPIQHGTFYFSESYPDSHLFADAEILRRDWHPDFMLVHPMGIDHAGHCFGGESKQYRGQAIATDSLLAQYLPIWRAAGYTILITADHGMNADGQHGGRLADVRQVPLFYVGDRGVGDNWNLDLNGASQLLIAPLICQLLAIAPSPAMRSLTVSPSLPPAPRPLEPA